MTQKDSKVNLSLAETTTVIACESKKDSSAIKAIAVLILCFLPESSSLMHPPFSLRRRVYILFSHSRSVRRLEFLLMIQALFVMPFINRDGGDLLVIKAGFKYYRAVAIPLALFVL